jgi:hypothetical protein
MANPIEFVMLNDISFKLPNDIPFDRASEMDSSLPSPIEKEDFSERDDRLLKE